MPLLLERTPGHAEFRHKHREEKKKRDKEDSCFSLQGHMTAVITRG